MIATIHKLHSAGTLREAVVRINQKFEQSLDSDKKAASCRLAAGQMLIELRKRIEEGGEAGPDVKWWRWYNDNGFVRSRKDAEKVMRLAGADDPEAAHEEEKAKAREGMQRARALDGANVSSKRDHSDPDLSHILELIEALDDDQRQELITLLQERYRS